MEDNPGEVTSESEERIAELETEVRTYLSLTIYINFNCVLSTGANYARGV